MDEDLEGARDRTDAACQDGDAGPLCYLFGVDGQGSEQALRPSYEDEATSIGFVNELHLELKLPASNHRATYPFWILSHSW